MARRSRRARAAAQRRPGTGLSAHRCLGTGWVWAPAVVCEGCAHTSCLSMGLVARCTPHGVNARPLGPLCRVLTLNRQSPKPSSPTPPHPCRPPPPHAQESTLWAYLTIGLNMQSLHHIVPGVSYSQLPRLYPAYRAICEKHGIKLLERRNLAHAFWTHLQTLWVLSKTHSFVEVARKLA